MGRGDRPPYSGPHLRNAVGTSPRYEVVLEAEDEFVEIGQYIRKDSPKNADDVLKAILKRRDALGSNPGIGHADPSAPLVPPGASAFITVVKKIAIYYLYPLTRRGREIVYVLSIRRGARMPLEEPEYARRWLEELARIAPTEGAPSEGPPPGTQHTA